MLIETPDGSLVNGQGKVVHFSAQRFIKDIVDGNCCFICGARPDQVAFNHEHVISDWLLRRYNLHRCSVTLPNNAAMTYDQYKIPCCEACNTRMGREIETPVQALVDSGIDGLTDYLEHGDPRLLFTWLTLIFLKTHLKDTRLRQHLDFRKGGGQIADAYTWEDLHHLHCVARSFYSGANLDASAIGSILLWPAKEADGLPAFDYHDLYAAQTMLIRVGEIAILAVLNDACATLGLAQSTLQRITGHLSPIQLRELLGHFAYINVNLTERPQFYTHVQAKLDRTEIRSQQPQELALLSPPQVTLGEMVHSCCQDILKLSRSDDQADLIRAGNWTFLFRDGQFIEDSMAFVKADSHGISVPS